MSRVFFLVLTVATVLVVSAFWKTTPGRPFFYDEADYMYAGTRGFVNNYLDRPSLSTVEFVRQGLALARDKSQRSNMSQFIRSSGDITFYRHYHGPIYAYWIALWQAFGFHDESEYRASGLLIHALVTGLLFWFFRGAFPEYPPVAALAAAMFFLFNRTALVSATSITQHGIFGLMAALTLYPLSLFCRTKERRYWYVTAAALGVAFSTVETSFILVAAVILVLSTEAMRTGWKPALGLFGRGTLIFVLAILIVWPKGVIALGALKGYVYLAYIALVKKTFTPMSPAALWGFKLSHYPQEFGVAFLALIAATAYWRKLTARQAVLPYLVYSWLFLGVTMVITAPYTYYHDSLMLSCSVVLGVVSGELWRRNTAVRIGAAVVLLASMVFMGGGYYRETEQLQNVRDPRFQLLSYVKSNDRSGTMYVPYELVPTLHYYFPELKTVGYDTNWAVSTLASAIAGPDPAELLCEEEVCRQVASMTTGARTGAEPVMGADAELQKGPLYSLAREPLLSR